MSRFPIVVLFALLAACAGTTRVGTDTIDARYTVGGGVWDSGGGITAVVRIFERNGATVVCGAWTTDRQSAVSIGLNGQVIQAASTFAGGTRLMQNLGFMARYAYAEDLSGRQASCVATAKPWQESFAAAPAIRFPQMAFPLDEEASDRARFRQADRPAIVR